MTELIVLSIMIIATVAGYYAFDNMSRNAVKHNKKLKINQPIEMKTNTITNNDGIISVEIYDCKGSFPKAGSVNKIYVDKEKELTFIWSNGIYEIIKTNIHYHNQVTEHTLVLTFKNGTSRSYTSYVEFFPYRDFYKWYHSQNKPFFDLQLKNGFDTILRSELQFISYSKIKPPVQNS